MDSGLPMNTTEIHTLLEEQRAWRARAWQCMLDAAGTYPDEKPAGSKVRANEWQKERAARNAAAYADDVFRGFNTLRKQS